MGKHTHTQRIGATIMSLRRICLSPSQLSFIDEDACRAFVGASRPEYHDQNRPQKRRKLDPDDRGWFSVLQYEFDCPFLQSTSAGSRSAAAVMSTSEEEVSIHFDDPVMTVSRPGPDTSLFAFACQDDVQVTPLQKIAWLQKLASKDSPITPNLRISTTASIRELKGVIQSCTLICRIEIRFYEQLSAATKISLKERLAILDDAFGRPLIIVNADRFYANIGKLPTDYILPEIEDHLQHQSILCQLFPFQKRAVAWMLQREGLALYHKPEHLVDEGELIPLWEQVRDLNNRNMYISRHQGLSTDDESWVSNRVRRQVIRGGILAEVPLSPNTVLIW